jgi:hypothetical protein
MKLFLPAIVLLTASMAVPARAGDVKLQVANGRVTLQARDATVREILAEWARVGQVKIVNGEKVMGAPVTLELQGVPEAQALNTLLRSVSGYMAAPKLQPVAGASMYDRIVIMATPRAAAATASFTTPTPQQPQYRGMPPGMPNPALLDDQDESTGLPPTYSGGQPVYPGGVVSRGTILPPQLQPGPSGMLNAPVPGTLPQGAPGTVSPMPQMQPGLPGQPGMPAVTQPGTGPAGTVTAPQPVKKPGGPGGPGGGGEGSE